MTGFTPPCCSSGHTLSCNERAIADYLTAAWGDGLDARLRATVVGNTVIGVLRAALVAWGDQEFSVSAVCDELLRRMFAGPLDHPLQSL